MKITPVAEMQQGIIISFYAIFFTFSARNPPPLKRVIGERRFLCLSSVPKKQNKSSGSILT